ncbi:hypothetical protein AOQ84DRAFT_361854 [Glonium stellatum]|uniref:Uncharacterized protein n=1 Tax=Glonium stellatum TaxID=574774 RepID=A0A8E2F5R8_9PEZI|nr:hypothetical protein AOQ84DRAFT_361854 [Glonium stellatum]
MSATEVVRKRGRPKKDVAAETESALTVENPAPVKKTTTRKASTKATKASAISGEKPSKSAEKSTSTKTVKVIRAKEEPAPALTSKEASNGNLSQPNIAVKPPKQATPATPSTSKILQEVAAKGTLKAVNSSASVKPTSNTTSTASTSPPSTTKPAPTRTPSSNAPAPPPIAPETPSASSASPKTPQMPPSKPSAPTKPAPLPYRPSNATPKPFDPSKPSATTPPSSPPKPPPPTSKPTISPTSTNAFAVSHLSARPGSTGAGTDSSRSMPDGQLPAKYKPAARRIMAIMVALPIAIVTGYELYQRLVLGEERKLMPRIEPLPDVKAPQAFPPTEPEKES